MQQRYELRAGPKVQVWEIWVAGTNITTRTSGKGKPAKQARYPHGTTAAARTEAKRMMAEKEAKGWIKTLDDRGVPLRRPAARNPALEAAILRAPDERDGYTVYGDWLTEAGDPRGELIAAQVALEDSPKSKTLAKRVAELHKEHARDWLGTLWGMEEIPKGTPTATLLRAGRKPQRLKKRPPLGLGWRWGFVRSAYFQLELSGRGQQFGRDLFLPFVSLAIVAFLQELTLEVTFGDEQVLPALCATPLQPALRRLTLLLRWTNEMVQALTRQREHFAAIDELRVGFPAGSSVHDEVLAPLRRAVGARVTFLSESDVIAEP